MGLPCPLCGEITIQVEDKNTYACFKHKLEFIPADPKYKNDSSSRCKKEEQEDKTFKYVFTIIDRRLSSVGQSS